jgi:hypothetical protein
MEWKIAITDKSNQRIVVRFDPKNELLVFIGQYKPKNRDWVDFVLYEKPLWSENKDKEEILISAEDIQELLLTTYNTLRKRLDAYENISEGFTIIKEIEIKEED